MTITKTKNQNQFTITNLTMGKLIRLKKALELDQKETGSTLGAEMLETITMAIAKAENL